MRALMCIVSILLGTIAQCWSTPGSVTLAWDASSDPRVVGCNLYQGSSSRTYTNLISAGQNTSVTVSNLAAGGTYYFSATAIDLAGIESAFSTEVVYKVGGCVITLTNLVQTYDGTPGAPLVSTRPTGLIVTLTYNGLTPTPIFAGSYLVIASVADSGYFGSSTNTLTISKATGLIQLANLNQSYDGMPKGVSITTVPAGLVASLTYNGSSVLPSGVGTYQVVATFDDPNYLGGSTGTLTISKAVGRLLSLNWVPTGDPVIILQSTDLVTWMPLTNTAGPSGYLTIPHQTGANFFTATSSGPDGTKQLPLLIRMP